jgi:hypothetical protein
MEAQSSTSHQTNLFCFSATIIDREPDLGDSPASCPFETWPLPRQEHLVRFARLRKDPGFLLLPPNDIGHANAVDQNGHLR